MLRRSLVLVLEDVQSPARACLRVGGTEWRPSWAEVFPQRRRIPRPREYLFLGSVRTLANVRRMLTPTQSSSTAELGYFTCLALFSFRTALVRPHPPLKRTLNRLFTIVVRLRIIGFCFLWHRRQRFLDVPSLPDGLGHCGWLQLGIRSVGFLIPQLLRVMSPHFTKPIHWGLCVPSSGVDVVSVTSWAAADS